jgi:hypothetical protein
MKLLIISMLLIPWIGFSQPLKIKKNQSGLFSLGVRTTVSAFNDGNVKNPGMGIGGQFRIQASNRLNTEWFFDYITSPIDDVGTRVDYHIGWSVMCYILKNPTPKVRPYIIAGHCFDHSELKETRNPSNKMSRGSSAVQAGMGAHFNLSDRLDLSLTAQYMMHLGKDIHAHLDDQGVMEFEKHKGSLLEGHLLIHVGINYKIVDLWGKQK